jgi:hypothetical protein
MALGCVGNLAIYRQDDGYMKSLSIAREYSFQRNSSFLGTRRTTFDRNCIEQVLENPMTNLLCGWATVDKRSDDIARFSSALVADRLFA